MNGVRRLPEYLLERLAAGDLSDAEASASWQVLRAEPGGEERLRALRRDDAAGREVLPPARFAAEPPRPRRLRFLVVAPGLAAAAALGLWTVLSPGVVPPGTDGGLRAKGLAPHLVLHRKAAAGAELLAPGARARPGDLIQIGLVGAGRGWGVVVSIDGRGTVTRHLPATGDRAAPLPPSGEALVPASFRLDDAPAFERFLLVVSRREFRVDEVVTAARALAARADADVAVVPLDGDLEVASALVRKEVP